MLALLFDPAGLTSDSLLRVVLLGVTALLVYFAYRILYHRDFGVPVRRRLLQRRLRVERDQVAFVPFWWSDIQVQRAIRSHWKEALRSGV